MGHSKITGLVLMAGILIIAMSCSNNEGDSVTNVTNNNASLSEIRIEAAAGYVLIPSTPVPLSAIAVFEAGGQQDWTNVVQWTVNTPDWAAISYNGILTPQATGIGYVRATHPDGWFSEVAFEVNELEGLSLTVEDRILLPGEHSEVSVAAHLDNGDEKLLSSLFPIQWEFGNSNVMSIDDRWYLSTGSPGQTTLSAVYQNIRSIPTIVMTDSIETFSCAMDTEDESILPGDTLKFSATATTRYAGTITMTDRTEFSSSDPLNLIAAGHGVFVPVIPGEYTVTATSGSMSDESPVIDVWQILSISLSPLSVPQILDRGDEVYFTATAEIAGHGMQDLTEDLVWESSNSRVARFIDPGQLRAVSSGTTTVSAYSGLVSSSFVEVVVETTPLVVEDWESYPLGTFYGDQTWDIYLPSYDSDVLIVDDGGDHDQVLMLVDSSVSYSPYCISQYGLLYGMTFGVFEVDVKAPDPGVILFADLIDYGLYSVASIGLRNQTIYLNFDESTVLSTYTYGEWLHLSMEFDAAQNRFTALVNDEILAQDMPFYNTAQSIDYIGVRTRESYGSIYADNIYVDADTTPILESLPGPVNVQPNKPPKHEFRSSEHRYPMPENTDN